MRARHTRVGRVAALLTVSLVAAAGLAGCATSDASDANTIRFALDWTPNTNHTGLFVAQQEGYFADAGLNVEILPYNSTSPDTLIDSGNAEFGISFHSSATYARAAGAKVTSVMAPLQHWATGIGVRADRQDIRSPRDLDGRTYAGFGDAGEEATLRKVIENDGGTGDFDTVVLGTSAYEAVYSGTADFTVSYFAWEGLEAERAGTPMTYFDYTDFGFPDSYAIVVDGGDEWMAEHPEQARQFVQALQKGYQKAADDPDAGARDLIDANPGAFPDEDLVVESQRMLAKDYMLDENGRVGTQTLERWSGYSKFLFDAGVLAGPDGAPLTTEPDWSTYFTDEYLDQG